jgi:hypothetical protein
MAPIIAPMTAEECAARSKVGSDLGPAKVVFREYCTVEGVEPRVICIDCSDQRNDLQISMSRAFTSVSTQCSARPLKTESSKEILATISLGAGFNNPEILAALFDTSVEVDPSDTGCEVIKLLDTPGKDPTHWEVAFLPIDGGQVSSEFALVLYYAMAHTESSSLIFSPSTPREFSFAVYADPHPITKELGGFYFNCPDLIASLDCEVNA